MAMRRLTALIADGESARCQTLGAVLAASGYAPVACSDAASALRVNATECPDLVLVDLELPPAGGLALVEALRRYSEVPLLVLGTDHADAAVVRALDLGADDYVALPCASEQVLARIRAVLRRVRRPAEERRRVLVAGDVTVDFVQRRLFRCGREVPLRPTEWQLLVELAANAGRLLAHEELLTRAWGPEYRHDRSYLRVGIRRLRRKLEDDAERPRYIRNVPGRGYVFDPSN